MNIKKELLIGLLMTVGVFVLSYVFFNKYQNLRKNISLNPTTNISSSKSGSPTLTTEISLTQEEVAKHNQEGDCWFIINQSVYNVTNYFPIHSNSAKLLLPYCGKDATSAYDTKGGRGSHSSRADADLANLIIGKINEKITQEKANPTMAPVINNKKFDRENEYEDD